MKKAKIILPLAAGCLLALASCDNQNSPVNVVFWSNLYTDAETGFMDGVVSAFNEETGHEFKYEKSGRYSDIYSALNTALGTPANLPNMAVVYPDYVYNWIGQDVVLDMNTMFNDSRVGLTEAQKADYVQNYLEEGRFYSEDTLYTLPFSKTAEALYYNETYLNSNGYTVPSNGRYTWRSMIDTAISIVEEDAKKAENERIYTPENKGTIAPIGVYSTSNLFITMSEMLDIPYASNEDTNGNGQLEKSEVVLFNNDKAKSMVKMLKMWYDMHLFTTAEVAYNYAESYYIETPFANGQMYFCIDSTKGYSYFSEENNLRDTRLTLVPSIEDSILSSTNYATGGGSATSTTVMSQGGSLVFFDKAEEESRVAFEFYKKLSEKETNGELAVAIGSAPFVSSAFDSEAITEITSKNTIDYTTNPSLSERNDYLLAKVYDLYETYDEEGCYYMAPVNAFSSAQRTAVEQLLVTVLTSSVTYNDAGIDKVIDDAFTAAYEAI